MYFASLFIFFRVEVNRAKNIIIAHCPKAKENNNATEKRIFVETAAIAIILANIGEEQGLEASAKNAPTINGNKKSPPVLFWGIFFTIDGNCISKKPSKFNPRIIITEANININLGEAIPVNALPDNAHITPIILNTIDYPNENESI